MYLLCYTVHWIFTIVYLKLNKTMNWGGYLWLSKVKRLMKSLTLETLLTSINFDWALEPCSVRPVWFLCYLWLYNDGRVMFCRLFSFNFMGGCLLWFVFCCFYFDSMFRLCMCCLGNFTFVPPEAPFPPAASRSDWTHLFLLCQSSRLL